MNLNTKYLLYPSTLIPVKPEEYFVQKKSYKPEIGSKVMLIDINDFR
jgi:hypothetical protein